MDQEIKKRLLEIGYKNEHGIPLTREEELFEAEVLFGKEEAEFVVDGSEVIIPEELQGKGLIGTR